MTHYTEVIEQLKTQSLADLYKIEKALQEWISRREIEEYALARVYEYIWD